MNKERLAAFSDGVIAIIITIMVLELKMPHGDSFAALRPLLPVFLGYVLSFIYVGIYWNNHHHLLYTVERVNGSILWANMHLLFWLSLVPFVTTWKGESPSATAPSVLYGVVLLLASMAYWILQKVIVRSQGDASLLSKALGEDTKGKLSPALCIAAIVFAFIQHWVADGLYVLVALMWLIPDRRIERALADDQAD